MSTNIIVNTSNQTPIEIALGIDEEGMTTARKLYAFLELRTGDYARWYKKNITENEFAEENADYFPLRINAENPNGGRPTQDSRLSSAFAKKLSMQSKTVKGEQARQYFLKVEDKLKETVRRAIPMTIPEQIQLLAQGTVELNQRVDSLGKKIEKIEYDLPILPVEADRITEAVKKKGTAVLGGKQSNAYANRSIRQKVYSNIYSTIKYQFQVKSYKAIRRNQMDKVIEIIDRYEPPVFLKEEIDSENAQEKIHLD